MARSDDDLLLLLAALESDQVERKSSASDLDRISEAICAFSNDLPSYGTSGVIFVGVSDDGRPTGLAVTDELLLRLAHQRDTGKILPLPSMRVGELEVDGARIAFVEVEPSPSPPVRFDGRVWIRVGPRRAKASLDEERRLSERRRAADLTFDARPCVGASIDELDINLFRTEYVESALPPDVVAENGRSVIEQLAALRLGTLDGTPTFAGLLVLAEDPTRYLPGAYVQFVRVDGLSLDEPILDEKHMDGPVGSLLRQLDDLLKVNIRTAVTIGTDNVEARQPDYPLRALQQLVRNAVLHRNYEGTSAPVRVTWYRDRIDIFSPGGPYGSVTPENFGRPGITDYRNPVLAEAMRILGYVQRFGAGLEIARAELVRNSNPPPEFTADGGFIGVTIRSAT